jgi:aryl-alcohol dehydrogenase-like predicted oxidoreductase
MGSDFLLGQDPYTSFQAYDAYWEAGGNTFDSAHCYGDNSTILGAWLQSRGLKGRAILFDKGCHPYGAPRVSRECIISDIFENHRKLGVEHTDFFVFHRDDPSVPVKVIVDTLNELKRKGIISAFGGSNWQIARIDEANKYAKANGLQGFSLNNPNMSLAVSNEPMWAGAVTISDEDRKWHAETGFPLFSWSSMARGYFARVDSKDVIRTYDNSESQARRARAEVLANERGLSAMQIALAWTLNQPGNVWALCGMRNVDQVKQCVEASEITFSEADLRFLEFGE